MHADLMAIFEIVSFILYVNNVYKLIKTLVN